MDADGRARQPEAPRDHRRRMFGIPGGQLGQHGELYARRPAKKFVAAIIKQPRFETERWRGIFRRSGMGRWCLFHKSNAIKLNVGAGFLSRFSGAFPCWRISLCNMLISNRLAAIFYFTVKYCETDTIYVVHGKVQGFGHYHWVAWV